MTTGMLQQETVQTSPSGSSPRFRPYASANHHVTKGRYITSNDPRGYIPVYEYPLNGQWIMMDIDDGYILWTGIWKALGNSKADIVKMIDSQPDLAPLIRRVRGGYLKIQGTWMPYEVALKLSRRVAWTIRDDLIPLFGPTFPSTCLSPDQPGYGQVVPSGQGRRRARRATQTSVMQMPRAPTGWTVVTPNVNMGVSHHASTREDSPSIHPVHARSSDYPMGSPFPAHSHARAFAQADIHHLSPLQTTLEAQSRSSHADGQRYSASSSNYSSYPPTSYRKASTPIAPPPNKAGLSIDVRSLSMREGGPSSEPSSFKEDFKLPPILAPNGGSGGNSPYALPPISAMEDLRGPVKPEKFGLCAGRSDDHSWARRHSLSVHPAPSKPLDTSPRFQPYTTPRSYQDLSVHRVRSPSMSSYGYHRPTSRADLRARWSEPSHEGDSTSNPSPTSPTTPSSLSENEDRGQHYSGNTLRGKPFPGIAGRLGQQWPSIGSHHASHHHHTDPDNHGRILEPESNFPAVRRNSYEVQSDSDSVPLRPW
ncbi:hypothetical protein M413DRAFT_447160 [Hebeloma cylindrosporum]|uniref:HTH APSES-type domain-containing protein n=1 Tax=Hebeloma cylindrosporum TaxID=76867 RepID=A0A0C3C6I6_HEBCY|nr:hypothetical protein M413DRAFT_447160 [Hebeloma cylindrosporum h7]